MQIARYRIRNGTVVHGIVDGDSFRRLPGTPFEGLKPGTAVDARDEVKLLAPVDRPRVFGLGLNYVSHITETNSPTPTRQMLFMKPDTAVVGPDEPVIYPHEGRNIHFEAELAIAEAWKFAEKQGIEIIEWSEEDAKKLGATAKVVVPKKYLKDPAFAEIFKIVGRWAAEKGYW